MARTIARPEELNRAQRPVYRRLMRFAYLLTNLLAFPLHALTAQPDRSIIIVRDEQERRMRGAYAHSFVEQQWVGTKRCPAWTVELHFTVSADYPYSSHEAGRHQAWPLTPDTVRIDGRRHLRFRVIDCWCEQKYLLVRRGEETMRIELDAEAGAAQNHSGEALANEVIVFRPRAMHSR